VTVCLPPWFFEKVTPSPSLNVFAWPFTVTVTLELLVVLTPSTFTI